MKFHAVAKEPRMVVLVKGENSLWDSKVLVLGGALLVAGMVAVAAMIS